MSDKIELNRRRVLGGIATVGAASAALGAGTFAYFSDEVESNDNTITAGELTLDVTNGDDEDDFSYEFNNIVPGDQTEVNAVIDLTSDVENTSDISVTTTTDSDGNGVNLADALSIEDVEWGEGNSITNSISADTIGDLDTNDEEITLGTEELSDGSAELSMTVKFDETTNSIDDYQNESVDISHTFSIDQISPES